MSTGQRTPRIVHQARGVVVIDKPAGMPVQPGTRSTLQDSVIGWAKHTLGDARLVHRLDKETSGLLVLSTQKDAHAGLTATLARSSKVYLTVLDGPLTDAVCVDAPLPSLRDRHGERREEPAQTWFFPLATVPMVGTLCAVRLGTGRKHQIRRHAALMDTPVHGDARYGRPAETGLALHAAGLFSDEREDERGVHALRASARHAAHPRGQAGVTLPHTLITWPTRAPFAQHVDHVGSHGLLHLALAS